MCNKVTEHEKRSHFAITGCQLYSFNRTRGQAHFAWHKANFGWTTPPTFSSPLSYCAHSLALSRPLPLSFPLSHLNPYSTPLQSISHLCGWSSAHAGKQPRTAVETPSSWPLTHWRGSGPAGRTHRNRWSGRCYEPTRELRSGVLLY